MTSLRTLCALTAVAFTAVADGSYVEVRPRPRSPGADAQLDVGHVSFGAPGKQRRPVEFRQRVRVDSYPHAMAFLKAEAKSSISRRACSTVVDTGDAPVAAA